jgi:hypothetical protein
VWIKEALTKRGLGQMPKTITETGQRIRANFYLTEIQMRRLKRLSRRTGLSASEILRRAIDEYWEGQQPKKKRR